MRTKYLMATLAFGLASCGSEAGGDGSQSSSPEALTEAENVRAPSKGPDTLAAAEKKFGGKFYSLADAMKKEVFGLRFNMTQDEARAALEANGFHADSKGFTLRSATRDLSEEIGMPESSNDSIGKIQKWAKAWIRLADGADPSTLSVEDYVNGTAPGSEYLRPYFYVDANGVQRLFQFSYIMKFTQSIDPKVYAKTINEKLGEPTRSTDQFQAVNGTYNIQLAIPAGYEADDKASWDSSFWQHPVKVLRADCVADLSRLTDLQAREGCDKVFKGNAEAQRIFDAITGDWSGMHFKRNSTNEFLEYTIAPHELVIVARGNWIPRIREMVWREKEVMAAVEAERARIGRTSDAPKGL